MQKNEMLSRRCQMSTASKSMGALMKHMQVCAGDEYDEQKNPEGFINLGTAVNGLNSKTVKEKFLSQPLITGSNVYQYFPEHGIARLQKAMAEYMTTFFETADPVQPDNIYFTTSALSALDVVTHCLADPGGITPTYGGIIHGLGTRSLVELWPIALSSKSHIPFKFTIEDVEESYKKALEAGKCVRGVILLNPGNPIGYVVETGMLYQILNFCQRYHLHFISDEAYAMSIHDPEIKFHSVLKMPSLPDPDRTHVIYAVSKDLGLTRLRVGVLHTFNKALQNHIKRMANFQCVAYPVMEILANILEDKEWCEGLFKSNCRARRDRYLFVYHKLKLLNLEVHNTPAAVFLWVNFKHYCRPLTFESEERLFSKLIQEAKLVIFPGALFGASEPGWFRITFTLEEETVKKGIERLEKYLFKAHEKL